MQDKNIYLKVEIVVIDKLDNYHKAKKRNTFLYSFEIKECLLKYFTITVNKNTADFIDIIKAERLQCVCFEKTYNISILKISPEFYNKDFMMIEFKIND